MIKLIEKQNFGEHIDATLTLSLHQRIKSRLRVKLDNGKDAGIFLARGTRLKEGDLLCSEEGFCVQVKAANEIVSVLHCEDPHVLARACYHLGNRHVSIQIEPDRISYLHDHVLDEMLHGLGMQVDVIQAPFEPEPGAYGGSAEKGHQGHHHGHHH